jgi:FkbM family methyltransferase
MIKKTIHLIFNTLGLTISKKPKQYSYYRNEAMIAGLQRFHDNHIEINSIIDVGAAAGTWSLGANEIFSKAKYLLFEPLLEREKELKEVCKSNTNFKFVPKAAGNQTSFINFNISEDLDGSGVSDSLEINEHVRKVEVVRIDDEIKKYDLKGPYLIKLDTHGFEVPILEGCENIIDEVNLFIIECYGFHLIKGSLLFNEMCDLMDKKGFRLFDIVDIMRRPKDKTFWQCDAFFIRKTHSNFNNNNYH